MFSQRIRILLSVAATCLFAGTAPAGDVTWNNGSTDFLWNTSSVNWSGAAWNNATFDGAIFGATGVGTISVPGAITVRSLNFSVTGYTIGGPGSLNLTAGGSSTLTATQINVTAGTATINTNINSLFGFSKIGAGNLVVSNVGNGILGGTLAIFNSDFGTNFYVGNAAGSTTDAGTVTLANSAALPSTTIVGLGAGNFDIGANNVTIGGLVIQGQNSSTGTTGQVRSSGGGTLTVNGMINAVGNLTGFGQRFNANLNTAAGQQLVRVGSGSNGANEIIFNNVISGNGGLTKSWGYTSAGLATSLGGFTLAGNNTYLGPTVISGNTTVTSNVVGGSNTSNALSVVNAGVEIIGANGGFGSANSVNVISGGNLVLDNVASVTAGTIAVGIAAGNVSDRLNTAAAMNLNGGSFQITGAASAASNQTVASLTADKGMNFVTLSPGTSGTSIMTTTGNIAINNGGVITFRSTTLPDTTAVAQATTAFVINGTTPALVGNIIPGATGAASTSSTTGTDFVKYNATNNIGIVRLAAADYNAADFSGGNVTRSGAGAVGVASVINSLRSTAANTTTLNANLTVTSGMILSSSGTATFAGTGTLDFGAARGYMIGSVTMASTNPITGSGGLSLGGGGTFTMPNDLTGLSGGIQVLNGTLNLTTSTNATAFVGSLDIKTGTASFQIADSGVGAVNLGFAEAPANSAVAAATLSINNAAVTTFSRAINVLGNGGAQSGGLTLAALTTASTTQNVSSAITLNNNLTITGGGTTTILNLNGPITGGSGIYDAYATGTLNVNNVGNNYNGDWFKTGSGITNFSNDNAGTGGLRMTAGTVIVSSANNIGSGTITLMGGTFQTNAAINFAQAFNIANAATLNTNGNAVSIGNLNGSVTSGTLLTKSGAGLLTVTGPSSFNGALTFGSNTSGLTLSGNGAMPRLGALSMGLNTVLSINDSSAALARVGPTTNVTLTNSATAGTAPIINLTTNAGGSTMQFGSLTVSGGSAGSPNGTVMNLLDSNAGNNTFTFTSLVTIAANNSLFFNGTANFGGSTAGVGTHVFFTTSPTLVGGVIPNATFAGFGGSGMATYDPTLGVVLFAPPIPTSGTFIDNINAVGPGSITSTNALFTTTGDTTANMGAKINSLTLDVGSNLNLVQVYAPQSGNANTAMNTLLISAGNLTSQNGAKTITATTTGTVNFGGASPAVITTTSDLAIGNGVTLLGTLGLIKGGAGSLTFGAGSVNSITGPYVINAGNVVLNADLGLSSLTMTAGTNLDVAGNILTLNQNSASMVAGNIISASGGTLTKQGTGVLSLTGTNTINTVNVNAGAVNAAADTALGAAAAAFNLNGGTFQYGAAFNISATRAVSLGVSGGTIDTNGFSPAAFGAVMTGVGNFTKTGGGTLTLTAAQNYGGTTKIIGGVLKAGIANAIPNTALTVGNVTTSDASSQLDLGGNNVAVASLTITARGSGSVPAVTGAGILTVNGNIAYADNTSSAGNAFQGNIAASVTAIDLGGAVRNITVAGQNNGVNPGDFTINTVIQNGGINYSGNNSTTQSVPTGMTLNAATPNTYSLGTTVNAGTLNVAATTNLGTGGVLMNQTGTVASAIITNSSLAVSSLATGAIASSTLTSWNIAGTGAILTVNQSSDTSFGGVLSGVGGLTKSGGGRLSLSGVNTYTGSTLVSGGNLQILNPGSLASPTVSVTGGRLSGTGSIAGTVSISTGAFIAPGASPGTLTITNNTAMALTLADMSSLVIDFNHPDTSMAPTPGTHNSFIFDAGTSSVMNIGANLNIIMTGTAGTTVPYGAPVTYTLATFSNSGGTGINAPGTIFAIDPSGFTPTGNGSVTGFMYAASVAGNNLLLTVTPVPEPATVLGIAAIGFGVGGLIRRRFKKTLAA